MMNVSLTAKQTSICLQYSSKYCGESGEVLECLRFMGNKGEFSTFQGSSILGLLENQLYERNTGLEKLI